MTTTEDELRAYYLEQIDMLAKETQRLNDELAFIQKHGRSKAKPGRITDPDYDTIVSGPATFCDECGDLFVQTKVRPWQGSSARLELNLCVDTCLKKAKDGKVLRAYTVLYPEWDQTIKDK